MYQIKDAELSDVDLILDCKLDIIFNSVEIATMERVDMEKTVNYCEEDIRENLQDYKKVYNSDELICVYGLSNYGDGVMIDTLYVMPHVRRCGIATEVIDSIISNSYMPIYAWVDKNNEPASKLLEKYNFNCEEENEYKKFMKNENIKEDNQKIKLKCFQDEVKKLADKYGVKYKLEC